MTLSESIRATSLNILTSILFRLISFLLNIFILRRTSSDVLGIVNVRFNLLDDTILFLSREAFRRSCLKIPQGHKWGPIINVIWLGVPNTILWSSLLGSTWIYFLSQPEGREDEYVTGVIYILASTWVQSLSEPFFLLGQAYFFVKLRAAADTLWVLVRCIVFATAVVYHPESAISWGGRSHFIATLCYVLIYAGAFAWISRQSGSFPFKSLWDFAPNLAHGFDGERLGLSLSFYKQGMLKMVLTEGERYLMTFFDLLSFAEQGVFDAVGNLGSLAARFVFRNVEEGAFLYFNQSVARGAAQKADKEAGRNLFLLLRGMSLLGLTIVSFGIPYSHLLLHLYGGPNLSGGIGPTLLRAHCFLVLFLALNGVAECYVFAKMSQSEIGAFNFKMVCISGIFLSSAVFLVRLLGPPGFIFANMLNFILRIAHHVSFISTTFARERNPAEGMLPSRRVCSAFLTAGVICSLSEWLLYPYSPLAHLIAGGTAFLGTMYFISLAEKSLRSVFIAKLNQKFKKS